jgi:hypothetical protein
MTESSEALLRERYAALLARRAASDAPLPATLEEIRDLAALGAADLDRTALLDRVLADPRTRDEYLLLRELLQSERRPAAARVRSSRALAVAAMVAVVLGAGALWRARGDAPEPMRGDGEQVQVVEPRADAEVAGEVRFVWHPVPGATAYVLEVADATGASVLSRRVVDTTVSVPADVRPSAGDLVWWVTAERTSGEHLRSAPRPLRMR